MLCNHELMQRVCELENISNKWTNSSNLLSKCINAQISGKAKRGLRYDSLRLDNSSSQEIKFVNLLIWWKEGAYLETCLTHTLVEY
jgi:hypothetical protein